MGSLNSLEHTLLVPVEHADAVEHRRLMANAINSMITGGTHPLRWEDYSSSINAARVTGASQPTWAQITDGIYGWRFSQSTLNECWLSIHVFHNYAPGTKIYPHIHWASNGTDTGTCRWGFEYSVAKGHQQQAFPSSTTVYVEQAAQGTALYHMIAEVSDDDAIPADNLEIDSIILLRLFRDAAHANDTLANGAFAIHADMHVQVNRSFGSVNKAPNFYE